MSQNYRAAFSIYEKQNEDLQECLIDVFSSHKSLSGFFKKLSPLLDKKGRNDPETLDAIYVLARECDGLGRHDDAEKLYSEVVRGRMEKSRYDPATLEAAVSLATALRRNRRHDEAIAWYGEVLDILINLHSASEPIALATAFQLGSVMEEVGYYDDARQWYENVLEKQMENPKLGPGHPNTLNTSHGLASVLGKLGDYEGAELWYVETLNGMLKVLGKSHPDTRSTWWELQLLCNRQGRNQTLENCRKALDSAPEQAPQTSESKITTVTVKEISVYSGDDTVYVRHTRSRPAMH
jgi:tetratricopeptide (TPR) repeat protein